MKYVSFNIKENVIKDKVRKITISKLRNNINTNELYEFNVILQILRSQFVNKGNVCFGDIWNNSLPWINDYSWK